MSIITTLTGFLGSVGTKCFLLLLLFLLWAAFVEPVIDPLVIAVQWFFNQSLYKLFPLEALDFVWDTIVFWSSLKILLWIFSSATQDQPSFVSKPIY